MSKIVIIDYKMGNIFSIQKRLKQLGYEALISDKKEDIQNADKIILPGVGHFGKAMKSLTETNLLEVLNDAVLVRKKPILGICLGMQLMTKFSEEGNVEGLGWFDATVKKIAIKDTVKFKVPHTGWNEIISKKESILLNNIPAYAEFYFVHSYYVECNNSLDILTSTNYELDFTSAIQKEHIFGVQFHPEKSHELGSQMLKNFIEM